MERTEKLNEAKDQEVEDRRSLAQFFLDSPLAGSGLDLERDRRPCAPDRFLPDLASEEVPLHCAPLTPILRKL